MSKREPAVYLQDILTSLEKIADYIQGLSLDEFKQNEQVVDAVIRNVEIIGEAARNMPTEFTDAQPTVPWEKMVSMRNKVLHEYFGVDQEILWETITVDLPKLKIQIQNILH